MINDYPFYQPDMERDEQNIATSNSALIGWLGELMSVEAVLLVKRWRVEGCTWRKIADMAYELGHHDTVESQFGDAGECATDYVKEFKDGDLDVGCCWNATDSGDVVYETDCRNYFTVRNGTPKGMGLLFCPFCGEVLVSA